MPERLTDVKESMSLSGIKKNITQQHINLYAEASRDFNPIHVDEEFASNTPFGGTIAHGMLILSYISQMMTDNFGLNWLVGGTLNVRFKTPARPGDTITVSGEILKLDKREQCTLVDCDVLCSNQKGEPVIAGEAKVEVKGRESSH